MRRGRAKPSSLHRGACGDVGQSYPGTKMRTAIRRSTKQKTISRGHRLIGRQRFGRVGELRVADRPECGFDGRAQRTGHRPEWSGGAGSVGGCAEPRDRRETVCRDQLVRDFTGFRCSRPGSYSITASLKGFRDVQALVQVLVGNTTSQDIKLQVGASGDTVKVSGNGAAAAAGGILRQHGDGAVVYRANCRSTGVVTPTLRCSHRIPATTATPAW